MPKTTWKALDFPKPKWMAILSDIALNVVVPIKCHTFTVGADNVSSRSASCRMHKLMIYIIETRLTSLVSDVFEDRLIFSHSSGAETNIHRCTDPLVNLILALVIRLVTT